MAVVEDCVGSLARHGFTHFYFVNGHGGNVATISSAFQEIYARSSFGQDSNEPTVRCRLKSWWDNPTVNKFRKDLYGEAEGFHATPSEIAMTQYLFPATVGPAQLPPPPKLEDRFAVNHISDEYYEADYFLRRFPDGRVGSNPSLARPDDGRMILEAAVSDLAIDYRAFLSET
jgi:creatinine amidohydrolase